MFRFISLLIISFVHSAFNFRKLTYATHLSFYFCFFFFIFWFLFTAIRTPMRISNDNFGLECSKIVQKFDIAPNIKTRKNWRRKKYIFIWRMWNSTNSPFTQMQRCQCFINLFRFRSTTQHTIVIFDFFSSLPILLMKKSHYEILHFVHSQFQ